MNDFNRCNKNSGIYWLKKDLRDLKIKVKLKPQDGIISLPKFEDYSKGSNALNLENTTEEYIFKWQEKAFSTWEVQRYTDHHNCITDIELNYHENLKDIDYTPSKIFTYVHEDYYLPLPLENKKKNSGILNLDSCLERLSLNEPLRRALAGETISTTHLFKSEENINIVEEEWAAMHVVFDHSEYNEDSQLIYKQEATLLSLYHNTSQSYLIITPDVNNLELNPYSVETPSGVQWGYQYAVELDFDEGECGDELEMLLRKLHKRWERKHKHLLNFAMPSPGKKQYLVTLEILTARQFDMDSLYIEFDIKVPEGLECKDSLQGRTHTSEAISIEDVEEWSFGHIVEFTIETDTITESLPLKLFLEVISTDWWGRHRTEGYTYCPLPLNPGCYFKELSCKRPEELDLVQANSRRFFLGGCHLIKDLEVLTQPQTKEANFTYTTTGTIAVRWNIISQCPIGSLSAVPLIPSTGGTATALLQGAEAALRRYRRARERLAAATGDLTQEPDRNEDQPESSGMGVSGTSLSTKYY